MAFSYNLFNLADYGRLIHAALFNGARFPTPRDERKQVAVLAQSMLTVLCFSLLMAALSNGAGDWMPFLFGVAVSLTFGIAFGIAVGVTFNRADGVAFGSAIGIAFAIPYSAALLVTQHVTVSFAIGIAFSMSVGIGFGVHFSMPVSLAVGFAEALGVTVAFAMPFSIMDALGGTWSWSNWLATALVSGLIALWGGFVIGLGLGRLFHRIAKPKSAFDDWRGALVMLLFSSLLIGLLVSHYADRVPMLDQAHPLLLALIIFITCSRLFLWPVEAATSLTGGWFLSRRHDRPFDRQRRLFDIVFFDFHTILPLPGERAALIALANQNAHAAYHLAFDLIHSSGHLIETTRALRTQARKDPYCLLAHIMSVNEEDDREILKRYIFRGQPGHIEAALNGFEKMISALSKVTAMPAPQSKPGGKRRAKHAATVLEEPPPLDQVITRLAEATLNIRQADIESPNGPLPHGSLLFDICSSCRNALQSLDQCIDGFTPPGSLEDIPGCLIPDDVSAALRQLDQFKNRILCQLTKPRPSNERESLSTHGRQTLAAIRQSLLVTPHPIGLLLVAVIDHWNGLLSLKS